MHILSSSAELSHMLIWIISLYVLYVFMIRKRITPAVLSLIEHNLPQ